MLDLRYAPEPIGPFLEWLERSGFCLAKEINRDAYNQYVIFERDGIRFEFQVDRGDWTISMGAPGFSDTYIADSWEAYLDDYEPAGDPSALKHDVDFFTRRMDEALRVAAEDPTSEAKMTVDGTNWVRRRLGITGYEQRDAEALRAAVPKQPRKRTLP